MKRAARAPPVCPLAVKSPMPAKPANLSAPSRGDDAPERRERIYLFAVTSAAVFLAALLLVARREKTAAVETVLARPAADPAGAPTAFPREEDGKIIAAAELRAAIAAAVGQTPNRVNQDVLDHYRRHLTIREGEPAAGPKRRLTLRYEGRLPHGATVLNELTRRYVERHSLRVVEAARQVLERADQRRREAQARADEARRVVDAFLTEHFESLQAGAALEAAARDHRSSALAGGPGRAANPRWLELRDELAGQERRMQDLLAKLKPQHPLARNLQLEIEQTRRQLAATAQTLPTERARRVASKPAAAPRLERYREQKTRYRQLLEVQRQTLAEAERAQAAFASAQAAWRRAQGTRMDIVRFAQAPPSGRSAGAALALLLAVICGGVAAWSLPADPTFRDPAHAQRVLGVPVLGCVADPTMTVDPKRGRRPLPLRLVRRASELALLAFVVVLVVAVLNGRSFAALRLW